MSLKQQREGGWVEELRGGGGGDGEVEQRRGLRCSFGGWLGVLEVGVWGEGDVDGERDGGEEIGFVEMSGCDDGHVGDWGGCVHEGVIFLLCGEQMVEWEKRSHRLCDCGWCCSVIFDAGRWLWISLVVRVW